MNVSGVPEQKQEPRRVLIYEKGNFDAINNALQTYFLTFSCLSESCTTEEIWILFRNKILDLVEAFGPSRTLRQRRKQKPWFNAEIRKLLGKARRAYKKRCKDNSVLNLQELKDINNQLKVTIKLAKQSFFYQAKLRS